MKIGIAFDGFSAFGDALAFAKDAAGAGVAGIWMADHLGYREPVVSCLSFLLNTTNVRVVPTAVSPYLRHPMPTAMQMATLAEAAPGRVAIALGIGNPLFLGESGETAEKPIRVTAEFTQALRALWAGEPVHMTATRFRLNGARMMFAPSQPIPIFLAPIREQMLKLSGKVGDGVVLSAGLSIPYVEQSMRLVRDGAIAANRDYESLHSAGYISFLAHSSRKEAFAKVKRQLSFILRNRFLDRNIVESGIPIDQEAIIAAVARRDFEAAQGLIPDEAAEQFAVVGTTKECVDRLKQYAAVGLKELVLLMAGTPEDHQYGLKVIHEFR
jgi:alkanesulfonate monooxygenase SsuD/methylene tetrahydromethanopterin reductase-like flavin-dependent oxidoreductase (luciferase family)